MKYYIKSATIFYHHTSIIICSKEFPLPVPDLSDPLPSPRAVAEWLAVPETLYLLDMVRPDLLQLRTLSRALVLWDQVRPGRDWVNEQLPPLVRPDTERLQQPGMDYQTIRYGTNDSRPTDHPGVNWGGVTCTGCCSILGGGHFDWYFGFGFLLGWERQHWLKLEILRCSGAYAGKTPNLYVYPFLYICSLKICNLKPCVFKPV